MANNEIGAAAPGRTRWTLIVRAQGAGPEARNALGELIRRYENFIVMLIRCFRHPPDVSAEELKQEYLRRVLERGDFRKLNSDLGSFRGFLRVSIRRFLANEWKRWKTAKAGRMGTDYGDFDLLHATSADLVLEAAFAMDTLRHVLERLRSEQRDVARFDALKPFLPGPDLDLQPHASVLHALGMTDNAFRQAVFKLRKRFQELLHEAVADTLTDPDCDPSPTDPARDGHRVALEVRRLYRSLCEAPPFEVAFPPS